MDDDELEDRIAAWEIEHEKCPQCGGPPGECSDPDVDYYPQRTICWATVALKVNNRHYDELRKAKPFHDGSETIWSESYSKLTPFHYRDGVTIWVSRADLTPDDDFLRQSVRQSGDALKAPDVAVDPDGA